MLDLVAGGAISEQYCKLQMKGGMGAFNLEAETKEVMMICWQRVWWDVVESCFCLLPSHNLDRDK